MFKTIFAIILVTAPSLVGAWFISTRNNNQLLRKRFVCTSFLFGALAIALVVAINVAMLCAGVSLPFRSQIRIVGVFEQALIEEVSKFLIVLVVSAFSKKFKSVYDYIVLSTSVALGFAALENVVYLIGSKHILNTALTRIAICTIGHAACGIMMGFFYGSFKCGLKNANKFKLCAIAILVLLVPSFAHTIHNYLVSARLMLFAIVYDTIFAVLCAELLRWAMMNKTMNAYIRIWKNQESRMMLNRIMYLTQVN